MPLRWTNKLKGKPLLQYQVPTEEGNKERKVTYQDEKAKEQETERKRE